ncbi:unnamed protein product [Owenia fusiformis]|uniref:Cell division cycle protein 20 homolog n=1 Tax=Owenia fusiformis TaxID=6347 RepID=A0A8S4N531_OWEFU|nr:unnamed protein product [Owenia fusiformis]
MAQYNFENELASVLKMDAPITKGPMMRWQRKLNESNTCNNSMNCSMNKSLGMNASINTSTTAKTPKKSLNKSLNSKGSKTPKTPKGLGDRFIPNRSSTQFDLSHYKVMNTDTENAQDETMSPSKRDFQKGMSDNLHGDALNAKIMSYQTKAPPAPEGYQNNLKVLYSQNKTPGSCRKAVRHIPQVPERILDAPEILDDYYLNLLDWSVNNHLAVCLGGNIYLWNATSGNIQQLLSMENQEDYVSSVSWIKEGNYLAVGTSSSEVQLWDVENQKRIRSMTGHVARVGSLSWNSYVLSSGSRSGNIHHHDVRVPQHHIATLSGHTQEVCGLSWSPDGKYLASGGNDNMLNIWPAIIGSQDNSNNTPLYTFSQHQAAVKALAWCPWQPSLLASGGGTADRHIRFWNINSGSSLNAIDTKSQVCSILWSKEYKELISGHGFAQNQLCIWKYPTMTKVAELTGHTARILHMAMSPDGTTVVSGAADETLRLWKCFGVDPQKKKEQKSSTKGTSSSLMRGGIR